MKTVPIVIKNRINEIAQLHYKVSRAWRGYFAAMEKYNAMPEQVRLKDKTFINYIDVLRKEAVSMGEGRTASIREYAEIIAFLAEHLDPSGNDQ